jgi:hypothetical protein
VVVATMTVFGAVAYVPLAMMVMAGAMTGSYGLLAPAMSRLASPTWSAATGPAIRASRPCADSPAHQNGTHVGAPALDQRRGHVGAGLDPVLHQVEECRCRTRRNPSAGCPSR